MSELKLERISSVLRRTTETRAAWYAKVKKGDAPKPVKLAGSRAAAWVSSEIDAYINCQISRRDHLLPVTLSGASDEQSR